MGAMYGPVRTGAQTGIKMYDRNVRPYKTGVIYDTRTYGPYVRVMGTDYKWHMNAKEES